MAVIRFSKTYFIEPGRINEATYNSIKLELDRNPSLIIDPRPETFSERFSGLLKTLGICLLLMMISFGFFEDGNPMIAVGGICMMLFLVCIIYLVLEGPSYATYLKKKNNYFTRMKTTIQNSSSFEDFCTAFYGRR